MLFTESALVTCLMRLAVAGLRTGIGAVLNRLYSGKSASEPSCKRWTRPGWPWRTRCGFVNSSEYRPACAQEDGLSWGCDTSLSIDWWKRYTLPAVRRRCQLDSFQQSFVCQAFLWDHPKRPQSLQDSRLANPTSWRTRASCSWPSQSFAPLSGKPSLRLCICL